MNINKLRSMALAAIPSMFAAGSAFAAIPGIPECVTAMNIVDGCQINVQGPSAPATLTARLIQPTGSVTPTTEADALAALESLVITVDGLSGGADLIAASTSIAHMVDVSVIAVDYSSDLSEVGTIQDIAAGFQSTLETINGLRGPDAQETAVLGYSLGGMVSRYALATMENANIDHNVGLYISYETPHKGVFIPQSLQNIPTMLDFSNGILRDVVGLLSAGAVKASLNIMGYEISQQKVDSNQAFIDEILGLSLNSTLAKQILIDNVKATTEFDTFFAEYDALGLPTSTGRNIAITNGNLEGLSQESWDLSGGKYYHFHGRIGSASLVNSGDAYVDAKFQLYPTIAGQRNIYAGIVGERMDILFGGFLTNFLELGTGKDFPTPADAKEYDTVAGGWLDMSDTLIDANDGFSALSDTVLTRHEPETAFSFVPVYSSLDISHMHDYSAPVDSNNSKFAAEDIFSMAPVFKSLYDIDNGPHSEYVLSSQIAEIIKATTKGLNLNDKVVLWLSDIDAAESCIDCNTDLTFRDVVSCDEYNFEGCLVPGGRRDSDAEYYGLDLYYHAIDIGFSNIMSMYDAHFDDEPSFTSPKIVSRFKEHVATFDEAYWNAFTKDLCESQDVHDQHKAICDKLP